MGLDEGIGFGAIRRLEAFGVPLELLAELERHIPQQDSLRESSGVVEVAGGLAAGLDRLDPLVVVADRIRDGVRRRHESCELFLGKELVLAVIRDQHSLVADEECAIAIFAPEIFRKENTRGLVAVIPGER